MKKGGLVLNVILLVAVAILFYLHFNSNKGNDINTVNETENTIPNSTQNTIGNTINELDSLNKFFALDSNIVAKPIKIAYVDSDSLDSNLKLLKDVETKIIAKEDLIKGKIEGKKKYFEGKFKAKIKNFETLKNKYTIKAPSLTDEQLKSEQEKLYKLQQELQYLEPQYQQELMSFSQELEKEYIILKTEEMKKYYGKVKEYCESIAKRLGFDFILIYQNGGAILYSNESYDISNYVINAINKEYDSKNKK